MLDSPNEFDGYFRLLTTVAGGLGSSDDTLILYKIFTLAYFSVLGKSVYKCNGRWFTEWILRRTAHAHEHRPTLPFEQPGGATLHRDRLHRQPSLMALFVIQI